MKKIKLLQKITAMASVLLVIALTFSCSGTNAPDQPQQEPIGEASSYSSSSDEQQYWCVNFDLRVCSIANSSTVCSNEGFLALNCPYSSNSGNSSSSIAASSSSSANDDNYGPLTYEGQTYETVVIGTQTWMAENLNYNVDGSRCYGDNTGGDSQNRCDTYGRLYNWSTAMKVCPSGWHLPTNTEWTTLINYVGDYSTAGKHLKATSGWSDCGKSSYYLCEDTHGFAALPGGYYHGYFVTIGLRGSWWSATDYYSGNAFILDMHYHDDGILHDYDNNNRLFSVRCLKN